MTQKTGSKYQSARAIHEMHTELLAQPRKWQRCEICSVEVAIALVAGDPKVESSHFNAHLTATSCAQTTVVPGQRISFIMHILGRVHQWHPSAACASQSACFICSMQSEPGGIGGTGGGG